MGILASMKERIGYRHTDDSETAHKLPESLSVGDIFNGLSFTFEADTCSSWPPYEGVEAGCTLECFGVMQSANKGQNWWIHLGDGSEGTDLDPDGVFIVLGIQELFEVTNARKVLELTGRLASAERSVYFEGVL